MNMTAAPSCRSTAPALRDAARRIGDRGIRSVAIAAIFSPLDPGHEREAAAIVAEEIPGCAVTCSADLGRIGLLERENAALLNAALADLAATTVAAFAQAIADSGFSAPLYITQNDGTVAEAGQAMRLPVYSFASGATNSMRGAAYLSGIPDAVVADVGGTTTDVGQIKSGFPREANAVVKIGGVRTLFRMPDLFSFGLGGGSHVSLDPRRGRAVVGRLPPDLGRARLRRRAAHRERYRHRGGAARYRRPGKGGPS